MIWEEVKEKLEECLKGKWKFKPLNEEKTVEIKIPQENCENPDRDAHQLVIPIEFIVDIYRVEKMPSTFLVFDVNGKFSGVLEVSDEGRFGLHYAY